MSEFLSKIKIAIKLNDKCAPADKLGEAEVHFIGGPLDGLKLIGFSVWQRRSGGGHNVTFPARSYAVRVNRY